MVFRHRATSWLLKKMYRLSISNTSDFIVPFSFPLYNDVATQKFDFGLRQFYNLSNTISFIGLLGY